MTKAAAKSMSHSSGTSQPWLHQESAEIQKFGTVRQFPLALSFNARLYSCERLNRILADTQIPVRALQETSLADAWSDLLSASSAAR